MENHWQDSVAERDFDRLESEDSSLIDEVVSTGRGMALEVEIEDVHFIYNILSYTHSCTFILVLYYIYLFIVTFYVYVSVCIFIYTNYFYYIYIYMFACIKELR